MQSSGKRAGQLGHSLCHIPVRGNANHLHLLVRIDPDLADSWTPIQVAQRWLTL
ncbi:MAG: hypothetical protein ACK57P_08130 [Planctomycetota bacterium]|jgi:hypothetical protein